MHYRGLNPIFFSLLAFLLLYADPLLAAGNLEKVKTITGSISPKSVVYDGKDKFFAQNMMYRHTVTVYDRNFELLKTIEDQVDLSQLGHPQLRGKVKGSPVEAVFASGSNRGYISNYKMYGNRFNNPGHDKCNPRQKTDSSFVYEIDTKNLSITHAIRVGSVPKFMAMTPDDRYLLVSNWCSFTLSIIDTQTKSVVKSVYLGAYPRGIDITSNGSHAFVAIMGSWDIAKVSLQSTSFGEVEQKITVGRSPRHIIISKDENFLFVTLNGEGRIAKVDLKNPAEKIKKLRTGIRPRSMDISADGRFLYAVNYGSNTVSKIDSQSFQVVDTVKTGPRPIGITVDHLTGRIWVACYSGTIEVFEDSDFQVAEAL